MARSVAENNKHAGLPSKTPTESAYLAKAPLRQATLPSFRLNPQIDNQLARLRKRCLNASSVFKLSKRTIRSLLDGALVCQEGKCPEAAVGKAIVPNRACESKKKRDAKLESRQTPLSSCDVSSYLLQLSAVDRLGSYFDVPAGYNRKLGKEIRSAMECGCDCALRVGPELFDRLLEREVCVSRVMRIIDDAVGIPEMTSYIHRVLNDCSAHASDIRALGYDPFALNPVAGFARDVLCEAVAAPLRDAGHVVVCCNGELVVLVRSERARTRVGGNLAKVFGNISGLTFGADDFEMFELGHLELCGLAFDMDFDGSCAVSIAADAFKHLKDEVRSITKRSNGEAHSHRAVRLRACLSRHRELLDSASKGQLDLFYSWLSAKVLCAIYRQQKKTRARVSYLSRCGMTLERAKKLSNLRLGYWPFAERYARELNAASNLFSY